MTRVHGVIEEIFIDYLERPLQVKEAKMDRAVQGASKSGSHLHS